ncbi:hypothetical protein Pfo_001977 [Paulownia fortunei]|nr:hypothetical protein Pfo_001977 [Paulownia fortunei]
MRAELYQEIINNVLKGETRKSEVSKRIILSPSFIGIRRNIPRRFLDALVLWKKIQEKLYDSQRAQDRPNLTSRIFQAKLQELKNQFGYIELPYQEKYPKLYDLVNLNNSCMVDGKYEYHYPRPYCECTIQCKDAYPIYKKRKNGLIVQIHNAQLNNQ